MLTFIVITTLVVRNCSSNKKELIIWETLLDQHYNTPISDSTDHITTSTNSHPIDRDINVSDGNSKILLDK